MYVYINYYFQQDGAPVHFHIDVRNYLNKEFPRGWAGRVEPIEYPPRSSDLTPLDFYLWGVLKDIVYAMKPETLQELRGEIQNAWKHSSRNNPKCLSLRCARLATRNVLMLEEVISNIYKY